MINTVTGSIQPAAKDVSTHGSSQPFLKPAQGSGSFGRALARLEAATSTRVADAQVTVQKGNTLSGLTRQWLGPQANAMNPQQLHQWTQLVGKSNGLTDLNRIYVGQVLDFSALRAAATQSAPAAVADAVPANALPALPVKPKQETAALRMPPVTGSAMSTESPRTVIVGDSIAVGIGGSLLRKKGVEPQFSPAQKSLAQRGEGLSIEATVGLSTAQILQKVQNNSGLQNAETAVISAGTNDMVSHLANSEAGLQKIGQNLREIRAHLHASRNIWVLPYDARARDLVSSVAREFGDSTVNLADYAKADRYHPKNYADIAQSLVLTDTVKTPPPVTTLSFLQSR